VEIVFDQIIVASTNLMIKKEVEIRPKKVMAASFDVNSLLSKREVNLFICLIFIGFDSI
jgi:hypothetical protein